MNKYYFAYNGINYNAGTIVAVSNKYKDEYGDNLLFNKSDGNSYQFVTISPQKGVMKFIDKENLTLIIENVPYPLLYTGQHEEKEFTRNVYDPTDVIVLIWYIFCMVLFLIFKGGIWIDCLITCLFFTWKNQKIIVKGNKSYERQT